MTNSETSIETQSRFQRVCNWGRNTVQSWGYMMPVLVVAGLAILLGWLAFSLTTSSVGFERNVVELAVGQSRLQFDHPSQLMLDKPATLEINVLFSYKITETVIITLTFPSTVRVTSPVTDKRANLAANSLKARIELPSDSLTQRHTFIIENIGEYKNKVDTKIEVTAYCTLLCTGKSTITLPIRLEGSSKAKWRHLFLGTVAENSTFILSVAGLSMLVAAIYRYRKDALEIGGQEQKRKDALERDKQEQEWAALERKDALERDKQEQERAALERKDALERDKQEQERAALERNRQEKAKIENLRGLLRDFRDALAQMDKAGAEQIGRKWERLIDPESSDNINMPESIQQEVQYSQELLSLLRVSGKWKTEKSEERGKSIKELATVRPNALVGAIVCASTTPTKDTYDEVYKQVSLERLNYVRLRDSFIKNYYYDRVRDKVHKETTPYSTERKNPRYAPDIPPLDDSLAQFSLASGNYDNPLLHLRAENEQTRLFAENPNSPNASGKGAFWPDHPVAKCVVQGASNYIVHGETGCGRTAMAMGIANTLHFTGDASDISAYNVYIAGIPTPEKMQLLIADHLLQFVCSKPLLLFSISENSRVLLITILSQALTAHHVAARLESKIDLLKIQSDRSSSDTQEENVQANNATNQENGSSNSVRGEGNAGTSQSMPSRPRLELDQLILLQRLVTSIDAKTAPIPHDVWMRSFALFVEKLGFTLVRLLVDVPTGTSNRSVSSLVEHLAGWRSFYVQSLLFVENSSLPKRQYLSAHQFESILLTWPEEQLKALARYRFEQIIRLAGHPSNADHLTFFFSEPNLHKKWIQSCGSNPRQLIKLWHAILKELESQVAESRKNNSSPPEKITPQIWRRALFQFRSEGR